MLNYNALKTVLTSLGLDQSYDAIKSLSQQRLSPKNHGDFHRWQDSLRELPDLGSVTAELNQNTITLSLDTLISSEQQQQLNNALQGLQPWRKGPFDFFGTFIDTEWRSDFKWQRLENQIESLENRSVLDIGCGSGYHLWRMLGSGAKYVIGVDPSILFTHQFAAVNYYVKSESAFVLPMGVDDLPENCQVFDSVFSMGVLYHRQSPLQHLLALKGFLRTGGELILETLIIEDSRGDLLFPRDRYAQMRNVWFIPSSQMLIQWLQRCGFNNVRIINECVTSTQEQRSTDWMKFNSLADFLDPNDPSLTKEGYPAPRRAIVLANA